MFFVIFFTGLLTEQLKVLPNVLVWLPDLFAFGLALFVVPRIIARKSFKIPLKYLVAFFAFMYVVISGIVLNEISSETIIAGIRNYFKYTFIFLLPLAYDYSEVDLVKQFKVLLLLGLIQVPMTFLQRFVLYPNLETGDVISGTVLKTTSLTIIMIGLIIFLIALYLKKTITLKSLLVLAFLLFLPTALNETKSTVIIFPAALVGLIFIMYREITQKQLAIIVGSGILLLGTYVAFYDSLYNKADEKPGFIEMMIAEKGMLRSGGYNYEGYQVDPNEVLNIEDKVIGQYKDLPTREEDMGRFDTMFIPFQVFMGEKKDVVRLFFGFGIGNVTSKLGKGGTYAHVQRLKGGGTTLSVLLWETGLLGVFIFILFVILIAWDSMLLAKRDSGFWGKFASGWFGITIIVFVTLPYFNLYFFPEVAFLVMFYSGMLVLYNPIKSPTEFRNIPKNIKV